MFSDEALRGTKDRRLEICGGIFVSKKAAIYEETFGRRLVRGQETRAQQQLCHPFYTVKTESCSTPVLSENAFSSIFIDRRMLR